MEISTPPQLPKFLIPHVHTFVSVFNASNKIYHWKFDEALKAGPENALAMRRDAFIMGCLRERQYPVARMKWHIEPEDKDDPAQQSVAEEVQKVVESIPRLRRLKMQLLEAVWYGRYGAQVRWLPKLERGRRWYLPTATEPVNGDKLQFTWDGTPAVMVYGPACERLEARGAEIVRSERAPAVLLRQAYWRERFIIHKHEVLDNDFFEGDLAGGVHGIGVRHYVYWMWWLRQEVMSWVLDFAERAGCGLWVYKYEAGNDEDRARALTAAKEQNRTNFVVWPRPIGEEKPGPGIEFIGSDMSGAEFLTSDVVDYFEGHVRRLIVGQELSSKSSTTGLGSGNGQAELQGQTKDQIIEHDANNLDETLTEDLIAPIVKHNFPGATFRMKHVSDVGKEQPKDKLESAKVVFDMGIPLDGEEVRGMAGLSKPTDDAETIQNQELAHEGALAALEQAKSGGEEGANHSGVPEGADHSKNGQANGKPKPAGEKSRFAKGDDESESDGHWVTIGGSKGEEGEHEGGTPVKITGDGKIVGGPAGLANKGIKSLADFGKTKVGEESGKYKPASKPKRQQAHEMTLDEFEEHATATGAREMYGSGPHGIKVAHEHEVTEAVRKGMDVPGHVLGAYPHLQAKATKKAASEALGYVPQEKQPWQMSGREWEDEFDKGRPRDSGGGAGHESNRKTGPGKLLSDMDRRKSLKMGLPDVVDPDGILAPRGARHREVIEHALTLGHAVPEHVLAEYPDLAKNQQGGKQWSPASLSAADGQTLYTADGALLDVKQDGGKWTVGNKKGLDAWSAAAVLNELKAQQPEMPKDDVPKPKEKKKPKESGDPVVKVETKVTTNET